MEKEIKNNIVAISLIKNKRYPQVCPYHPPFNYPEYRGRFLDPQNEVYEGVRNCLWQLGLDQGNFNTKYWNPFGEMIKPGMCVFIKPNLVSHLHEGKNDIFSVVVHASVLRPILDYVCLALDNKGKIIIGDSPLIFTNFNKILALSGIKELVSWYKKQTKILIDIMDLRKEQGVRTWLYGKWGRKKIGEDPLGYQFVNLGNQSCFHDVDENRLRIAIASYKNMLKHHSNGKHEYLFSKSFLESDVLISICKLKTHRRTGVTLALKNAIGIPSWKDTLPHFMIGSPEEGGDQYPHPSFRKKICTKLHDQIQSSNLIPVKFIIAIAKKILWNSNKMVPFKDDIYEGMWPGNNTLWRTIIDLNRVVLFADKKGKICNKQMRSFFCLVDGIIAGEGEGPLSPNPLPAGVLISGKHPVPVDVVSATVMGFDFQKIPAIKKSFEVINGIDPLYSGKYEDIEVLWNGRRIKINDLSNFINLRMKPHPNWQGFIEL